MDKLQQQFEHELLSCTSTKDVEALHTRYLGKKGILQESMRQLKDLSPEERPAFGSKVNILKTYIEQKLQEFLTSLVERERAAKIAEEHIDVTLPGRKEWLGSKHLITATIEDILRIFGDLGFSVQVGPQIDTEYYNFEVLNFPPDHPAKDMQDTFYIEPGVLLRTHTSTIQGRFMERTSPPIRIVCPGRVFRNEEVSARSHAFFHQIEGLYVDTAVSMQDLVQMITEFSHRFFGKDLDVRFRPSYFPFVEPGVEVDVECLLCHGKGCSICKHAGWLEILGAGMVHPQVLKNVGIDPEKYSGYAFGLGIERTLLIRHGIRDIRLFSENDLRFLRQFQRV
jgi:phenylalanyl-tRNA synthetase alpha chain